MGFTKPFWTLHWAQQFPVYSTFPSWPWLLIQTWAKPQWKLVDSLELCCGFGRWAKGHNDTIVLTSTYDPGECRLLSFPSCAIKFVALAWHHHNPSYRLMTTVVKTACDRREYTELSPENCISILLFSHNYPRGIRYIELLYDSVSSSVKWQMCPQSLS